ncbi:Uncharacterized protein Rs2_06037 [Raphanus sativus]|nr:Uncharacterized protein Rs2_06037 [Raphanus sativus]
MIFTFPHLREIPEHGDVTNEALSRSELEGLTLGWPPKTLSAGVDDIIFLFREIRSGEARVVNGTGAELDQARSDVQKLAKDRQKLSATKISNGEIAKAKPELDRVMKIKAEVGTLREEVSKGFSLA